MISLSPKSRIIILLFIIFFILIFTALVNSASPTLISGVMSEPIATSNTEKLMVHFIGEVEDGDSILIDLGETEILIDGGLPISGVAKYISEYVDGPLEVMVATHPHVDHIGGLIRVLKNFDVKEIWVNGDSYADKLLSRARTRGEININKDFNRAVKAEGAEVHVARRGQKIHVDNLTFDVLHPDVLLPYKTYEDLHYVHYNGNNNSIVLRLRYDDITFLFTGDIQVESEASILQANLDVKADILKVMHHGSKDSSSAQFLNAVKPKVAIYITGPRQPKMGPKKPHPNTIAALKNIGAEVYGTDTHGTVILTTDGKTFTIDTEK